jgi:hypothetical protein
MPLPLAQTSSAGSVFFWALVLIVFILILFVAVVLLKRWLKDDDISSPGPGFTLSDLRQLVAEGKMTQEEFDKAKVAIVGSTKAAAMRNPPPARPTRSPKNP